jgi:hypothetical protein
MVLAEGWTYHQRMTDSTGPLLAFRQLKIAVADLPSARTDWQSLLGWPPIPGTATFELDGSRLELVSADDGPTGVVEVVVEVDDIAAAEAIARRTEAAGGQWDRRADGSVTINRGSLNGVPLTLRPRGALVSGGANGPFRRISHLVVAVSDYPAAIARWTAYFGDWPRASGHAAEISEHVPVGVAWFGLTAAGTNPQAFERFIARAGEGVYAVGLTVTDRSTALTTLKSHGARLIGDETTPQLFLHPATTHGLLVDVVAR